jgi:cellulose synthase/poly-beta-1,6-N-acetylglucosamine synthase-like glycosyltransferase
MIAIEPFFYTWVLISVLFAAPLYTLLLRRWIRKKKPTAHCEAKPISWLSLPKMSVIIPTFNEENFIIWKLRNTLDLKYPRERLKIWVVDGGSTDDTFELAQKFALHQGAGQIEVIRAPVGGKIPQINFILTQIPNDHLVVLTDADSEIHTESALVKAAQMFASDPELGVFGGYTHLPKDDQVPGSERLFWDLQNQIRLLESSASTSNIALAPFYAFQRNLLDQFPANCVADDVHLSFVSHIQGKRVSYSSDVWVTERRFPITARESYRHKLRKTQAYTIELLRSVPDLPLMNPKARIGCLFRMLMFGYWPWAALYCLIAFPRQLGQGIWTEIILSLIAGAMIVAYRAVKPRGFKAATRSFAQLPYEVLELGVVLLFTLTVSFLLIPFSRQDSVYRKVTGST